ncbi:hypothetical protein [Pseudarthrobacter enclensis]|uniref:Uncharacterized protein n=1 Tax=Pseudarthrobacter enclensis TaxID=993070 RepID=A0ABT9RYH7_9MICC|nr:hypothetical protein [Pseudarthrobacter enclensis]MDP9889856.1 hypothetical protein [Pseudarthrobacter enclensis]
MIAAVAGAAALAALPAVRDPAWSVGPHFVGLKIGLVLLAIVLVLRVRRRILVRLRGLGWRRTAIASGAAAVLFYAVWIFYLSGTMPSVTVAYNWSTAWLALDGFEALAALLTAVFLFRGSIYAALTAAAFSTSLCIDALFDVTTAAQGPPLVTAILEAALVELPFAAISGMLAIKLLTAGRPQQDAQSAESRSA